MQLELAEPEHLLPSNALTLMWPVCTTSQKKAPVVDVAREPRWGRAVEAFSEGDAYFTLYFIFYGLLSLPKAPLCRSCPCF